MSIFQRTFGIEIECLLPRTVTAQSLAAAITAAGVDCTYAGYTHTTTRHWKIVTDGSVHGEGGSLVHGLEIVSPILSGEETKRQIEIVCAVLAEKRATINRTCGLHVHVDARRMSIAAMRKLTALYIESEAAIDTVMPGSRRGRANTYCGTLTGTNMSALARAADAHGIAAAVNGGSRYAKVNFTSFWRHGTVEFRHHSGTVDAAKIWNWALACLRMCAVAVAEADQPINVAQTDRPTNRRLATIYDLLNRPNGCTRQEVAAALGRTSMPPMNKILRNAGIAYRMTRNGLGERYYLAHAATTVAAGAAVTLAGWCQRLAMPAEEVNYWEGRAAFLRRNTLSQAA